MLELKWTSKEMKHFIYKNMIFTRKRKKENGYRYEEVDPFLTKLPTYLWFFGNERWKREWPKILERGFLRKKKN